MHSTTMEKVYTVIFVLCAVQTVHLQMLPFSMRQGFQDRMSVLQSAMMQTMRDRMRMLRQSGFVSGFGGFPNGATNMNGANPNGNLQNGFSVIFRTNGGQPVRVQNGAGGTGMSQNNGVNSPIFGGGQGFSFSSTSGPSNDWTTLLNGRQRQPVNGAGTDQTNLQNGFNQLGRQTQQTDESVLLNPNSFLQSTGTNTNTPPASSSSQTGSQLSTTGSSTLPPPTDQPGSKTSWATGFSVDGRPLDSSGNSTNSTPVISNSAASSLPTVITMPQGSSDPSPSSIDNADADGLSTGSQTVFENFMNTGGFSNSFTNSPSSLTSLASWLTPSLDSGPTSASSSSAGTVDSSFPETSSGSGSSPVTVVTSFATPDPPALTCTEEYQKMTGHTLCMSDDPRVTASGITEDDKRQILKQHNELRAGVQPPAADLQTVHWDDRLAAVAQKWAKQCTLGHDKQRGIPVLGKSIGQNVAVGYEGWRQSVQEWYDEIRMYRYGFEPDSYLGAGGWRQIAHFTQIVQNGTSLIGCGYAECPGTRYVRYYVCNYAAGQSNLAYPYTAGSRCGSCPNSCKNGLCDCGGLLCYNGGTLDVETCTCKCPKPYKGVSCEILDCPAQDDWICERDWPVEYCSVYNNVPEQCPYMCGICKDTTTGNGSPGSPPRNTTFISSFGCEYRGKRSTEGECRQYGRQGQDMRMCASAGGQMGCGDCQRYFNIKRDYCPVMCGLCDPPCAGKQCSNGGTLDPSTCRCSCRPPFQGDNCELAACPVNGDPGFCRFWPTRYCRTYYNVPEECPYKCGICQTASQRNAAITGPSTPSTLQKP